jgi:hypothetical protein
VRPVGAGKVRPRSEVDEAWTLLAIDTRNSRVRIQRTKIENELGDLANSNVLLPPDANASRALEVVPVHDDVNSQVQGDDGP